MGRRRQAMKNTGHDERARIDAEVAKFGVMRTTGTGGKPQYEAACSHCPRKIGPMFSPGSNTGEEILANFRRQGWVFGHKIKPFCSTKCAREAKQERKENDRIKQMTQSIKQPPETQTAVTAAMPIPAIGSDIRLTLRIGGVIEEHFDRDKRRWHDGWSDERIAKETSAALDFVIKVRREGFGELAEDPEETKMRAAIQTLEDKIVQWSKVFEDKILHLSSEVDEMKAKLDRHIEGKHHKAQG